MLEYDRGPPACTNVHKEINVRIIETRCSRPFIFFFFPISVVLASKSIWTPRGASETHKRRTCKHRYCLNRCENSHCDSRESFIAANVQIILIPHAVTPGRFDRHVMKRGRERCVIAFANTRHLSSGGCFLRFTGLVGTGLIRKMLFLPHTLSCV